MENPFVKGYPVCAGCKYSRLHHCDKFNQTCLSVNFDLRRYQLPCENCLDNGGYEEGEQAKATTPEKIGYFHLPGPENYDFYHSILQMKKYYPEAFYPNREISEVYGAFGGAIWNGRTPDYDSTVLPVEAINNVRQIIEADGINLNLTWNNHLIGGYDVYDRFCNNITECFHNGKHAITVASPELFQYLKEHFPNFTYYQSVIQTELDPEFVKKDDGYDMYLMNRKLNKNWDELLKIPEEERHKIEFLCNDACTPICRRQGHYNIVNKCLLNRKDEQYYIGSYCTIDHDFMAFNARRWPMNILPEDIDTYIENGFCHFKLCSRGDPEAVITYKVLKYLAKPEYFDDVYFWVIGERQVPEEEAKINGVKNIGNGILNK